MHDSAGLTLSVKKYAAELGADLVGIAPVSRYIGAPEKLRPQAHLPEAESVVVMAVHHPDASIDFGAEPNSNYPGGFQLGMIAKLDTMAFRMAKFIEKQGYATVPYACTYYWHHRKQAGVSFDHAATFSHMNAFVAAGLGEYGWHGMVMSPKYGPRQRIVSVFTAAPLAPDPLYRGDALCDRCKLCEKACWGENYRASSLLSPATVSFTIEDKKFEYANVNRWRCFWGEQCHLDMRKLAERSNLDEQGIYDAIDEGVERSVNGPAGYMCSSLKFCMSKLVRRFDRAKTANPLRKKPKPAQNWQELRKIIMKHAAACGADRLAILPLSTFKAARSNFHQGFRTEAFFNTFKWAVCLGRSTPPLPGDDKTGLAAKNSTPYLTLTNGRLVIGTLDIARYLDDAGHEAMQVWGATGMDELAAKQVGWGNDSPVITQTLVTDAPLKETHYRFPDRFDDNKEVQILLDLSKEHLPGVDMLGVADINKLPASRRGELHAIMPEANSLIVLGVELPRKTVELAGRQPADCAVSYQQISYQSLREAFWAAQDVATSLSCKGHTSLPLYNVESRSTGCKMRYVDQIPDLRAQAPYAAKAGLGFIGRSGLLISPSAGPRQRFAFVLTSVRLQASPEIAGSCPVGCTACADACPVNALQSTPERDVFVRNHDRCEWARVLGMNEGAGSGKNGWRLPDLPVPDKLDDEKRRTALALKDPIQVRCYRDPNSSDTQVERCLQACPL